ncbi:MAG: hypothetical protein LBR19_08560 [Bifidobacteriaceae bacterium]|jgi:hypothetical protein|nr:hypothetical protein [Bifidobacteriaceae bacterium]
MTRHTNPGSSPRHTGLIRRRLAPLALLGVLALSLTGCMKMAANFTINADDSVDGDMVLAMEDASMAEFAALMGTDVDGMWSMMGYDSMDAYLDAAASEMDEAFTGYEAYAQDGYTGRRYLMEGLTLNDIGGGAQGDLSITRSGDEYHLDGVLDMGSEMEDAFAEAAALGSSMTEMLESMSFEFSFTFPGPVLSGSGVISGNTITFPISLTGATTMTAVAQADPNAAPPTQATETPTDEPTETTTAEPTDEPTEDPTVDQTPTETPTEDDSPVATGEDDDEASPTADAAGGKDADKGGFPWLWVGIGAGVVGVGIIATVLIMSGRKRQAATATAYPAPGGYGQAQAPYQAQQPYAPAPQYTPNPYTPSTQQMPPVAQTPPPASAPPVAPTQLSAPVVQGQYPGQMPPVQPTQQMPRVDPNQPWPRQ